MTPTRLQEIRDQFAKFGEIGMAETAELLGEVSRLDAENAELKKLRVFADGDTGTRA